MDVAVATVEGGVTLDINGEISLDSQDIVGFELGTPSPTGITASIFAVETTVESSVTFQISESEEDTQ